MKIALAQVEITSNPELNAEKKSDFNERAKSLGADIVIFPDVEITDENFSVENSLKRFRLGKNIPARYSVARQNSVHA